MCFQPSLLDSKNPGKYLTCPSSTADLAWVENQHALNHTARSSKETFFISTLTCSTKLTQNRKWLIISLLNVWCVPLYLCNSQRASSPIHNFFVLKLTNNATQTSTAGLPTGTKLANIQHMILLIVIDLIPIFLENKTMLFDL